MIGIILEVFVLLMLASVNGQDHIQDAGDLSAQDIRDIILNEMNRLRTLVEPGPPSNMNLLKWSDTLEVCAMRHAVTCPNAHDGFECVMSSENMFGISWPLTKEKLESKVNGWWNEINSPGYNWYVAQAVDANWGSTGHYTNQDGARVTEVGCGLFDCSSQQKGSQLVCKYRSTFTDLGDYVEKVYELSNGTSRLYEVGEPCTNCRYGNGWCYKDLCVEECPSGTKESGECKCALEGRCNEGTLNPVTCQCECDRNHVGLKCDRSCRNFENCKTVDCNDPVIARTKCPGACGQCDCVDNGECVHGSFDTSGDVCGCVCENSWEGSVCDVCNPFECQNGGVWNPASCTCDCSGTWGGKDCSVDCTIGDPSAWPCSSVSETEFVYSCPNSWFRNQCSATCYPKCMELYLKDCPNLSSVLRCENGGNFNIATCSCDCVTGYNGDLCQTVDCSAGVARESFPCKNHNENDNVYRCGNSWFGNQCISTCNENCNNT